MISFKQAFITTAVSSCLLLGCANATPESQEPATVLQSQRMLQLSPDTAVWGAVNDGTQELKVWLQQKESVQPLWQGEITSRVVEDICFYESVENQQLSVFLIGGRGGADQLLLRQDQQWLAEPLRIRELNIPYDSTACVVHQGTLYIAEGDQAIWAYQAEPEADDGRNLVAVKSPFGAIEAELKALEIMPDGRLLALEEEPPRLLEFYPHDDGYTMAHVYPVAGFDELQDIQLVGDNQVVLSVDETGERSDVIQLRPYSGQPVVAESVTPVLQVAATLETEPASRRGDVIDDPAVWVHPEHPEQSRILATDKRIGLMVYDMQGRLQQELTIGRLNNVDVRGQLAAASLRNDDSIQLFHISANGELSLAANIPTDLTEIYGLCMGYHDATQTTSVYVNSKTGDIQHYVVTPEGGELVRELRVPSQPEGCVVDDAQQRLFVGEEDEAVWLFDALATGSTQGEPIILVAEHPELVDDIEGLAYAVVDQQPLLFVSSQGNDSYIVFEGQAPWNLLAHFRIRTNPELGIDGASETDGLEVTTQSLGAGFEHGALLVQDGRNRMPEAGQNVKLVPLERVLALFK